MFALIVSVTYTFIFIETIHSIFFFNVKFYNICYNSFLFEAKFFVLLFIIIYIGAVTVPFFFVALMIIAEDDTYIDKSLYFFESSTMYFIRLLTFYIF